MRLMNHFWLFIGGAISLNLLFYLLGIVKELPTVHPVLVQLQLIFTFFYLSLPNGRNEEK